MDIQEILDNITNYEKPIQEAINLAIRTYSGEDLELMLKAITGKE